MPDRPTSDPEQFVRSAPVLHVADVAATAAYYRDVLGFEWDFGDEEYSVVWRDNSAIHLARGGRDRPTGIHLFQWVRDVDAVYREIRERGAEVLEEPTDHPYQIREFRVRDLTASRSCSVRTSTSGTSPGCAPAVPRGPRVKASAFGGGCLCGAIRFRAACDAASLPPEFHIWVSHELPWVAISDELPQYLEWRTGTA